MRGLLDVTVLDEKASLALLDAALRDARPDDNRIGADRSGAARLAQICGGLPLALKITAALLKVDPSRTVRDLADELDDEIRRVAALAYDDGSGVSGPSVAAAFELSYRQLDEVVARVFRLLSVNPGPDVSTAAAAALTDMPLSEVRPLIGQLVRAHLVEAAPGAVGRWRMHDLLHLYARQASDTHAKADRQEQARDRLLRYYLDTVLAASTHLWTWAGHAADVSRFHQPRRCPGVDGRGAAKPSRRGYHGGQHWPGSDCHAAAAAAAALL